MDRIEPNSVYTLSLTSSTSGLLHAISFSKKVMPLNIYFCPLIVLWGAIVRSSDNSSCFCLCGQSEAQL